MASIRDLRLLYQYTHRHCTDFRKKLLQHPDIDFDIALALIKDGASWGPEVESCLNRLHLSHEQLTRLVTEARGDADGFCLYALNHPEATDTTVEVAAARLSDRHLGQVLAHRKANGLARSTAQERVRVAATTKAETQNAPRDHDDRYDNSYYEDRRYDDGSQCGCPGNYYK